MRESGEGEHEQEKQLSGEEEIWKRRKNLYVYPKQLSSPGNKEKE
jgi:hypothetical protein